MTSAYPLVSHISIHALREEGDGFGTILRRGMVAFLSTPSARRATMILIWYMNADEDFYPRPPRGGRPGQQTANDTPIGISIHALREEGDNSPCVAWEQGRSISIHALREEGDRKSVPAHRWTF